MNKKYKFNLGQIYQILDNDKYHEFEVLPVSLFSIIEDPFILNKLKKKSSVWTSEDKSNFAYLFTHYYNKYFCGILYQNDKPDEFGYTGTFYKRLFRKKRNTDSFKQEISLVNAYKQLSDQKQVTLGPNLSSRQVIVVDRDDNFTWNKYDEIINICSFSSIPYPSCIVINESIDENGELKNHFQIQWFLDDYFYSPFWSDSISKDLYNLILKTLTSVFDGDISFKGLFGKNPYCKKLNTLWIRDPDNPYIEFDLFLKDIQSFIKDYEEEEVSNDYCTESISISQKENTYGLSEEEYNCIDWKDIYSRNVTATHATGKRLLQLKNKGINITFNLTRELFIKYENFVASVTGKNRIENNRRINSSVKGVFKFVNKGKGKYDEEDRESSKLTKKYIAASKRLLIEVYKKKGYSQNKISKINGKGYSIATVSRLYNTMKSGLALKLVKEGYNYFKDKENNSKENSVRQEEARKNKLILQFILRLYKELIKLINSNPSLSIVNTLIEKIGGVVDTLSKKFYNNDIEDLYLKI